MPEGAREGILKGMYRLSDAGAPRQRPRVQLLGSGTILREVIAAAELLKSDFGVAADVWSCPSFNELRRDGHGVRALEHAAPGGKAARALRGAVPRRRRKGPVIAVDRLHPRPSPTRSARSFRARYAVLGTDGFGRSDYAQEPAPLLRGESPLRRGRGAEGAGRRRRAADWRRPPRRIKKYGIDPEKPAPWTVEARPPKNNEQGEDVGRNRGQGSRHRGLQGRARHRDPGQAGRPVKKDDSLITLESDKATMEVPAPPRARSRS